MIRRLGAFATAMCGMGLLVAACTPIFPRDKEAEAGNRNRAQQIAADPLLRITLPNAEPVGPAGGASAGSSGGPGASPSLAMREWRVTGSRVDAMVSLIQQLGPLGWRLSFLSCRAGDEFQLVASRTYGSLNPTASVEAFSGGKPQSLVITISASPYERGQGGGGGLGEPRPPDIKQTSPCAPAVLQAAGAAG